MIIGIDLGTTNSLVGVWQEDRPLLVPNALGDLLTPSVISVDDTGTLLVGRAARERLVTHPESTVAAFKRYMGSARKTQIGEHQFSPEELSALVLRSLKADVEHFLGESVSEAVITVPAYFNDTQRKATRVAGELAGLRVDRLLNEPTAAALAYGLHENNLESRFAVLDLGGGTFDVSVLESFEGVMEVRSSAGDNFLGGEDFVAVLVKTFMQEVLPERWRAAPSPVLQGRVVDAALQLMHSLSTQDSADMRVIWEEETLTWTLDNARFMDLAASLLERLRSPIERALRDSRFKLRELDDLLLVGGASRIAIVRQAITRLFGRFPSARVNPDEAIALGAVTQAALKERHAALDDVVLTDVSPYSLGVDTVERVNEQIYNEGIFCPIIERNTLIPVSREQSFQTVSDNQTVVKFQIYQGESRYVANNILLGAVEIEVPRRKAGEVVLDVRFTYDIDGLLDVDVLVSETGKRKNLLIQGKEHHYSEQELAERRALLASLKVHPRDQAENVALLARAERLYEISLGRQREFIGQCLGVFKAELESQDTHRIAHARKEFEARLAHIEATDGVWE